MPELWVCNLGLVPFAQALALQESLRAARQAGEIPDTLLLLEHPPVYTRGRRSSADELPAGPRFLGEDPIEVVDVDRGGRVTYHGPGQLVGYPIVAIGDVIGYLRSLERAIVATLSGEGLAAAGAGERPTGVWVSGRKIASIGVHVSRRVTTHGFAINADNDLDPFSWIVPCGMPDVQMTSVALESGRSKTIDGLRRSVATELARALERDPRQVEPERVLLAPVG